MNKRQQKIYDDIVKIIDDKCMTLSRDEYIELCDELEDAFMGRAAASRSDNDNEVPEEDPEEDEDA